MKPTDIIKNIMACLDLDLSVMLWGAPGVGKSEICLSLRELRSTADRPFNVIELRATLLSPLDLHGLPIVDKETMTAIWVQMGILPRVDRDGEFGVVFIDEITTCPPLVQAALFGLVLPPHKIGDYQLPPGWHVIAAGNRQEDMAAAKRMVSALANRFRHYTVDADVDDWITWAMGKDLPAVVIAFFRFRPALLLQFNPTETINATPRTWADVAKIIDANLDDKELERDLIHASIGEGPAVEFLAFVSIWRDLPSVDQILLDPAAATVPDDSATKYAIAGALAQRVREGSMDAFVEYLARLGGDFGVGGLRDATTRDPGLCATKAFQRWIVEHQDYYV